MTPNILLVDNDCDAVTMLAERLTDLGCHVSYTFDPRLALLMARKCKPDIAFLDLRMPSLSGFELAGAFRAEKMLAGCALVALGDEEDREATRTAGFQAHLKKPATVEELSAAVALLVPLTQLASP